MIQSDAGKDLAVSAEDYHSRLTALGFLSVDEYQGTLPFA
jgi:hypothetical protein